MTWPPGWQAKKQHRAVFRDDDDDGAGFIRRVVSGAFFSMLRALGGENGSYIVTSYSSKLGEL